MKECPNCKKVISIIEWNNYKQKCLGGDHEIKTYKKMCFAVYTCLNCKKDLTYYEGTDKLV